MWYLLLQHTASRVYSNTNFLFKIKVRLGKTLEVPVFPSSKLYSSKSGSSEGLRILAPL